MDVAEIIYNKKANLALDELFLDLVIYVT